MADQGTLIGGNEEPTGALINMSTLEKYSRDIGVLLGSDAPDIPTAYPSIISSFEKYIRHIDMEMLGPLPFLGSGGTCTGYPPEETVELGVVYGNNDEYIGSAAPKYKRNIINT